MKNKILKYLLFTAILTLGVTTFANPAFAATTGDLVNTESFFVIDDGDGTTDIELQFGDVLGEKIIFDVTNARFDFSDDVYVQGAMETTGDITAGGNIITSGTVDGVDVSDLGSTVSTNTSDIATNTSDIATNTSDIATNTSDIATNTSDIATNTSDIATNTSDIATNTGNITTLQGDSHTQNTDTGTTSNGFILDSDDTGGNVGIQFGTTLNEIMRWNSTTERFEFTDDLYVADSLEVGAGITVGGNIDFNGNEADEMVIDKGTSFPGSAVEGQTFYRTDLDSFAIYDGSSWVVIESGSGAGADSIFLAPVYANATYYEDGTDNTGTLSYYFDDTNIENAYKWESSRNSLQDYDIKVRIQVPDNFSTWDGTTPIEFKYRTLTTASADNQVDFTMVDTAEAAVTLSNNTGLVSSVANTWVESTNMGITGGTWTAGSWFTITIKTTAKSTGTAEAGSIVLNYNTSN